MKEVFSLWQSYLDMWTVLLIVYLAMCFVEMWHNWDK